MFNKNKMMALFGFGKIVLFQSTVNYKIVTPFGFKPLNLKF